MEQNARPDFYEGQYLGADDLDAVVDYHRIQQARHTVGAHTWGIGAGLELRERKLPTGGVDVSILPGIAWDGYGRATVVLAPTRISEDRFVNFQATTPPEGQLVKVWLRYAETSSGGPAPGFEVCRPDGQFSRVVEGFAIEVGEPTVPPHGSVVVAGRSLDALKVRSAFLPGAADLFDESVAYQEFPPGGSRPIWLVPVGYVRWLKPVGQPGRLVPRNDSGAGGTVPDSDLIRAFRQYIGVVVEAVEAADGLIRLRDRGKNPDPFVSHVRPPRTVTDPAKPPENDLVWVEGHLHVLGDARVSGGHLELRDSAGSTAGVPLVLRRVEINPLGGKELQVVVGAEKTPHGTHVFAVGPGKLDTATGQLKPDFTPCLVVRDDGTVGVGIAAPPQLLTLGGDKKTRLEIARISASLPWSSTNAAKNGDGSFVLNHQSQGSDNPSADFGLMRDRKLRVVLYDRDTHVSSQGGDVVISVNHQEPGATEVLRVNAAAKVGIGTAGPVAKLQVAGDIAVEQMAPGGPRPLPAGATLMWNDGTWLRLNQNLDFGKPIFGVHTPGLFASMSLNVGGVASWADPGAGNAWIANRVSIGAGAKPDTLHVEGSARCVGPLHADGGLTANGGANISGPTSVGGVLNVSGNFNCGGTKSFLIPHPLEPATRSLVHATLEGPEAAVYYRGEGRLRDGRAIVDLPHYFEALTRADGRTALVTPIVEGDEPASALAVTRVVDGRFMVRAITPGNAAQRFCWEVKALRGDVPVLRAELDQAAALGSRAVVEPVARG